MSFWRMKWQSFDLAGVAPRLLRSDSAGAGGPPPAGGAGAAPPGHTGGDKVLLPPEVLEALMHDSPEAADSPLTFALTGPGNTKTFCGVIEFTSREGVVTLPPAVIDALGLSLGDQVSVSPLQLLVADSATPPPPSARRLQAPVDPARRPAQGDGGAPAAPRVVLLGDRRPAVRPRVCAPQPLHGALALPDHLAALRGPHAPGPRPRGRAGRPGRAHRQHGLRRQHRPAARERRPASSSSCHERRRAGGCRRRAPDAARFGGHCERLGAARAALHFLRERPRCGRVRGERPPRRGVVGGGSSAFSSWRRRVYAQRCCPPCRLAGCGRA